MTYIIPQLELTTFTCPHCSAITQQHWSELKTSGISVNHYCHQAIISGTRSRESDIKISHCTNCKKNSIRLLDSMIYPGISNAPLPNNDLSEEIRADYLEARDIVERSPRGACSLLRLGLQKLMVDLGESGTNINDDIAALVQKGLNPKIQQALDIVRVIGNEAVHPGELNLRDDKETATSMFGLINAIAYHFITHPKEVDALYVKLPASKIAGIEARDNS